MRQLFLILFAVAGILPMMAEDTEGIEIRKLNGETLHIANSAIRSMSFVEGNAVLTAADGATLAIQRREIVTISSLDKIATEYSVNYDGATATVINPYALQGVTTEIDGGYVTTINANEAEELTFSLSGETTDGGFLYNGSYKCTLRLNGVNITSQRGAAVDVKCGKRIAVVLVEGTENTLADFAEGEQKAALYFKGHPEFEKGGALNVKGNANHAISAKEYIQLKKSVGEINILAAKNDGIHAGQYFQMNGGRLTIDNVLGDGVQAEVTDNPEDEQNGQMIIKGGTIDIRLAGEDVAGLKSDSLMTISGGEITINATGAAGKGIKAKDTFVLGNKETGEGPRLTISTSGARLNNGSSTGGTTPGTNPGGRPGGGGWPGGGGGWPPGGSQSSGSSSKAIKATGIAYVYGGEMNISTVASGAEGLESKKTIYIEGGRHYFKCYDDCINCAGNIYFNGGVTVCYSNGNDAVDSNAGKKGAITIGDGVVLAYTSKGSPEEGLDCDNNSYIQITGHGIGISAGGAQGGGSSSTISGAQQGYNFVTTSISYATGRYYTLADADGKNLVTYSFEASVRSSLSLFTATGMTKGSTYTVRYSTQAPTDATTEWHGLYLGSSAQGTTSVTSFTAK